MDTLLQSLREELINNADETLAVSGQKFFKETIKTYGMKTALVTKIANRYFNQVKDKPKEDIYELCEELWRSGYIEESFIACNWAYALKKHYEPEDFRTFTRWISNYVSNWASCDTLCNHTVGTFIEKFPARLADLKNWAASANRWMRRAAAVSLIIPARKGKFKDDIFEIAEILLTDTDDMVQKGYGWMLKAASESDQAAVFDFIMKHKSRMPRTALRYAIEKMPAELRARAMAK